MYFSFICLTLHCVQQNVRLCMGDISESCSTPTCIEVPSLNRGQTLILALPFLSVTTDSEEEDLLCPVHPLPGERCVNLLSCNRFKESVYVNSISICRRASNGSSLEMCFYNITDIMNGTRLHFFYSDLQCPSDGFRLQSSRTYMKAMQLLVPGNRQTSAINV